MSNRLARRWCTAVLLVATATTAGAGTAHAGTAGNASAGYVAPPAGDDGWDDDHYHHRHHHPNCNNDPNSGFAMDPEVCPPSRNYPGWWGPHY
ncbi:MAG TPA: hypothetical protein VHV82_13775 [Sporichthyaceae bacterium]|jgi:hypothetical protein|nr:hypothetical protein [Sporichthyaceae bacterium]